MTARPPTTPRALLAGWFSFLHGEATAGDLAAGEVARQWLARAGMAVDVLRSPVLGGPTLDDIDPGRYTHTVFVCGPDSGWQVDELVSRMAHTTRIALGVSHTAPADRRFDLVLARDGDGEGWPDLSLAESPGAGWPLVALVKANPQPEYGPRGRHADVHLALEGFLARQDVAVVGVDTRVDPRLPAQRDRAQIDGLLAPCAAVVTTRLHGLVLALRAGVPALAVDPIEGGAKVAAQARRLGWHAVLTAEQATLERGLEAGLRYCLSPPARTDARRCADDAALALGRLERRFAAALDSPVR